MMKYWLLSALLSMSCLAVAEDKIPTTEKEFVAVINSVDKAKILAQFGEPATKQDLTDVDSDKVTASVWQYHKINTAVDGSVYETTELDFVEDKVVVVVFMNGNGVASQNDAKPIRITPPAEM